MAAGSKDLERLSRPGWGKVSLMAVQRRPASVRIPLVGGSDGILFDSNKCRARWGGSSLTARSHFVAFTAFHRAADNSKMLFLLSPAKSLDYETLVPETLPNTQPRFEGPRSPAAELIKILRQKS